MKKNFNNITKNVKNFGRNMNAKYEKNKPEILLIGGLVTVASGVVFACKGTLKAEQVVRTFKSNDAIIEEQIGITNDIIADPNKSNEEKTDALSTYNNDDYKSDKFINASNTVMNITKSYLPAAILLGTGAYMIVKSHCILNNRFESLAAAYVVLDKTFKKYRKEIVNRYGSELDKEVYKEIHSKKVINNETGKEETVPDHNVDADAYSRYFGEDNPFWTKDAEANKLFLLNIQNWANNRLQSKKYLYLNEVYEALGMEPTVAGRSIGWVYNEDDPDLNNYVSFGIFDDDNLAKRLFVNGDEKCIFLNFNVDGPVFKYI